jgi:hypothetical protein
MTPIEIIRAVNAKVLTVRAALQLIGRKKEQQPEIPGKIKVLDEHIRQELG